MLFSFGGDEEEKMSDTYVLMKQSKTNSSLKNGRVLCGMYHRWRTDEYYSGVNRHKRYVYAGTCTYAFHVGDVLYVYSPPTYIPTHIIIHFLHLSIHTEQPSSEGKSKTS